MSRLIGIGILVVAIAAIVWFLVRDGEGDETPAPAPVAESTASGSAGARTGPGPSLPSGRTPGAPPNPVQPATHDSDGMIITDHRTPGGDPGSMEAGSGSSSRPERRLTPSLVRSIHANAKGLVETCGKKVPKDARTGVAKLGAKMTVAISGGALHVVEVNATASGIADGPELAEAKKCVQDILVNFESPTPDEADLESYPLELGYVLR
jgi:hypothetical protein